MKVGIGIAVAHGPAIIRHGKPLLTAAQLDELQRQVAIYRYIAAGLIVPSALVLPIWKSVAASSGFANGGIYRPYPSIVEFSPQDLNYRNMMDSEPVRCRRTDGKKWKCRRSVVPGQKYCERHIHRGRQRSRKPVEASQTVTDSNATPLHNSIKNSPNVNCSSSTPATLSNNPVISCKSSSTACSNLDATLNCTTKTTSVVNVPKSISTNMTPSGVAGCIKSTAVTINGNVHMDSTVTTAIVGTNKNCNENYHMTNVISDKYANCSNYVSLKNLIGGGSNSKDIRNTQGATSQGFDFSQNSVLQVQGCRDPHFFRSYAEPEPRRCRRTDGKKWRCRRDVVPNEKYCKMHMHRGAKKRVEVSEPPASGNSTSSHPRTPAILPTKENVITDLNTNLSISISVNPQLVTNDNASDNTVSSDTTISDTIVASCEDGDFSS
ncbi:growth-regulating factor 9 isoform X2 [Jatropha curcas]|nr:growth-regulating factor 9 isoform X2 [Jatropha curcas]